MTIDAIDNYFVCIGAQKSGTTWLARMLSAHPEIFVTPVKEIHYFDHVRDLTEQLSSKKRRSRYRKYHQRLWTQWTRFGEYRSQWAWYRHYMSSPIDDAWYAGLFRFRGGRRVAGEVTPEYAIVGEEGLRHIRRLAPDARVIFIMRNPVARTWSQVLHQCRARGLDANRQSLEAIAAMLSEPRFAELSDYASTLDAMAVVFRPDQTLPLFYEEMHRDRLTALATVCRFLGVGFAPGYFGQLGRRFNRSQEAALPPAVRDLLRDLYRDQVEAVRRRIGRVPEEWDAEFGVAKSESRATVPSRGA
jgi:hypothetical protein